MGLLLIRIDDRLIHGQVVEGWVKYYEINHIVVSNNSAASDEMQKALFSLAVPENIKLSILSIEETKNELIGEKWQNDRALILLASSRDVLTLVEKGAKVKEVNLGGLHYFSGKVQIERAISVNKEDLEVFEKLDSLGIKIEIRVLPTDEKVELNLLQLRKMIKEKIG